MYGHEFSRIESNVNIYGPYIYENMYVRFTTSIPLYFEEYSLFETTKATGASSDTYPSRRFIGRSTARRDEVTASNTKKVHIAASIRPYLRFLIFLERINNKAVRRANSKIVPSFSQMPSTVAKREAAIKQKQKRHNGLFIKMPILYLLMFLYTISPRRIFVNKRELDIIFNFLLDKQHILLYNL